MLRILLLASLAYLAVYALYLFFDYYGQFSGAVVLFPFAVYGPAADAALGDAIAASLALELNNIRDKASRSSLEQISDLLADAGIADPVRMPPVSPLPDSMISLSFSPLSIGPVSVPINRMVFNLTNFRATVVTGVVEDLGEQKRISASVQGDQTFLVSTEKGKDLVAAVKELAYRIAASQWASGAPVSAESLRALVRAFSRLEDWPATKNPAVATEAIADLKVAASASPRWSVPKFFLGKLTIWEGTQLLTDDRLAAAAKFRDADALFRKSALLAQDSETRLNIEVGRLASLLQLLQITDDCDEAGRLAPQIVQLSELLGGEERRFRATNRLAVYDLRVAQAAAESLVSRAITGRCARQVQRALSGESDGSPRLARAQDLFRRALAILPDGVSALRGLAQSYGAAAADPKLRNEERLEKLKQALDLAQRAIERVSWPYGRGFIANLLMRIGNLSPAERGRLAQSAQDQLLLMADEQTGSMRDWAIARAAEIDFILGNWKSGVQSLLSALVGVARQAMPKRPRNTYSWLGMRGDG
jgi:tetratricopeptide (TPR) repeat protein